VVKVSDAVYCAGAIVKACENNTAFKLKIGIHLGEVVFKDDGVFGDGANIASRIHGVTDTKAYEYVFSFLM